MTNVPAVPGLYGLVICGGISRRMGKDKSLLDYHGKPQCYHMYEMLSFFCEKVFISCNEQQADGIEQGYETLTDLDYYCNSGPVAGLLTALTSFPHHNFLMIGCDYPFLHKNDLVDFLPLCNREDPAAFYNEEAGIYEPMLAYYHCNSKKQLLEMFEAHQYSLQHFLKEMNATKFYPKNKKSIISIDTSHDFFEAARSINLINQR